MSKDFKWKHIYSADELECFYKSILPAIRERAKELGYAIGVHGSLRRDLDLIAIPWIEKFADKESLAKQLQITACGINNADYVWEKKPNGRMATSFPICWTGVSLNMPNSGHIDLSVFGVKQLREERK